jgi:hypothetical protein
VAALASLDNVRILREENNDTLLTDTTDELIKQLLMGIAKSKAREPGITEATYKGYITNLVATDSHGTKCETTRRQDEDESSWLWRACECLLITEQTATDKRPCVWITFKILVLPTRFFFSWKDLILYIYRIS